MLDDGSIFSKVLFQWSLILRYTSAYACRFLLKYLPILSMGDHEKLCHCSVDSIKTIESLNEKVKLDLDVTLLKDETYLHNEVHAVPWIAQN